VAAVFFNCRAQDRVVAAHRFLHGDAIMLPPRRAAFDVGEGKRHPGHPLSDSASRPRLTFSNGAVGKAGNVLAETHRSVVEPALKAHSKT